MIAGSQSRRDGGVGINVMEPAEAKADESGMQRRAKAHMQVSFERVKV